MNGIRVFFKKYWFYIAALLIPWGTALINCYFSKTWVMGEGNILRGDMREQIVPFYYELWNKIHMGESLSYTWSVAGGCDFTTILGCLISPFTLLILIFPQRCIVDLVQFIMIMKWALVSVSMVYFFYHTRHNVLTIHKKAVSLFLGLAFGMGSGMINFIGYPQFNDVIICFPFLLLLVEKMVDEGKWKLYYLVLTFCMLSNLYFVYHICIFLIMWFVLQLNGNMNDKWKKFLIFVRSSLLSACTCVGNILVTFALSADRLETEDAGYKIEYISGVLLSPIDFIKQLFILEPLPSQNSMDPNIYFSVLGVVIVSFFLFIKVGRKRKLCMTVISLLLTASYFFGFLDIIWHCFTVPNAVYHRFTNLFVFMMLLLALHVLIHMKELKIYQVLAVGVIHIIILITVFLKIESYNSYIVYLGTLLLTILYIMLFFLYCRKSINYRNMLLTIVIFGIMELCVNAYSALDDYTVSSPFFSEYLVLPAVRLSEDIELKSGERVSYVGNSYNIGMITSKDTDAGFLSSINGYSLALHRKLGMKSVGRVSYTPSGTSPLLNYIYNIRYGIGESPMAFSDAEVIGEEGDYQLYTMKHPSGLGYMVRSTILDWGSNDESCFELQNEFVNAATGKDDIFHVVKPEKITCENASGVQVEPAEEFLDSGWYYYQYRNQFGNEYDTLKISFSTDRDIADLYWYGTVTQYCYFSVYVDGEMKYSEHTVSDLATVHIGEVKKGQQIDICAVPSKSEQGRESVWYVQFAEFDEEAYAKAYEILSKNIYDIEIFEDDYVKGSIQADEEGIMMTSIQAAKGWEVFVDGEKTEYETVAEVMIGVPLSAGKHVVEFKYHTPRVLAADVVSLCSFGVFILLCVLERKKKASEPKQLITTEE